MGQYIDLRSDTVTTPTPEMRRAMAEAEVGDDVYGEDPTVNRLQELAAAKVGKEAALYVTSGTQGNQCAVMTHTRRGDEVILEAESHIFYYELGGVASLSGAQVRTVRGDRGILDPKDVKAAIRDDDLHHPPTTLVCMENTHNRAGGVIVRPEQMKAVYDLAKQHRLNVHVDGARIFNAAVALGRPVTDLTQSCDTVMFCLSKGLSAPVGSILAGSREFIERARRSRKVMGGGMRQAGVIAAAGIIALEKMVDRLAEDHANAKVLAEGLAAIPGIELDPASIETNIVYFEISHPKVDGQVLPAELKKQGILVNPSMGRRIRMVTHKDIDRKDVDAVLMAVARVMKEA
ncbi:MAG TPA: low-specificity L-threonine aldolase [Bacillota bacterium]|jgi:threonine aldolase